MGERKVLNRYVPPDFDPSLLENAKIRRKREKYMEIRMMLPFSLRCNTCGEYIYQGKKFNSKKEDLEENYMGIRKIRFYIKCTACSSEITFKTDPKNADYEVESGASRNFESWKEKSQVQEEETSTRQLEEAYDPMKSLENKTMDNKMEMDVLDALDEIKAINQRHHRVDTEKVLSALNKKDPPKIPPVDPTALTAEDEALIKSIKFKSAVPESSSSSFIPSEGEEKLSFSSSGLTVPKVSSIASAVAASAVQMPTLATQALPIIIKKKRKVDEVSTSAVSEVAPAKAGIAPSPAFSAPSAGLFDYGGSDSDSGGSTKD